MLDFLIVSSVLFCIVLTAFAYKRYKEIKKHPAWRLDGTPPKLFRFF